MSLHTFWRFGDLILMSPIHGAGAVRCADTTDVACWYAVGKGWAPRLSLEMVFMCVALGIAVCREDGEIW